MHDAQRFQLTTRKVVEIANPKEIGKTQHLLHNSLNISLSIKLKNTQSLISKSKV